MNRYFKFIGGTSAKFWGVTVSGYEVTVRFSPLPRFTIGGDR